MKSHVQAGHRRTGKEARYLRLKLATGKPTPGAGELPKKRETKAPVALPLSRT